MIDINKYMEKLIFNLKSAFSTRLVYVGLQGSYSRDEATQNSDIDIAVILDQLLMEDMDTYRQVINTLECADKSCGFICGKDEMKSWNPLEICQLVHETKDYYGALQPLVPAYTRTDVMNYVKLGICNVFHMICHEYIHVSPEECHTNLQYSYKTVFYLLQNLHYLRTSNYIKTKSELLTVLNGDDLRLLQTAQKIKEDSDFDFTLMNDLLFHWCKNTLKSID